MVISGNKGVLPALLWESGGSGVRKNEAESATKNVVQKSSLQIENKKETKKEKAQILKKKRIRALFELKRTKKKKKAQETPKQFLWKQRENTKKHSNT